MGLDMYLTKKHYIEANFGHRKVNVNVNITIDGKKVNINPERIFEIIEQVGYWRKANQIHNWFVKNVQGGKDDCKEYWVSKEQFHELLKTVNQVLENVTLKEGLIKNGYPIAKKLLPTVSGCYFGSTNYDQYYYQDLEYTKNLLETILEEDDGGDYYYSSSW